MNPQEVISREFIFADCGMIMVEGSQGMIDSLSKTILVVSRNMIKHGKKPHDCVLAFTTMLADPKWVEHYPGIKMIKSKVICPKGILCLH